MREPNVIDPARSNWQARLQQAVEERRRLNTEADAPPAALAAREPQVAQEWGAQLQLDTAIAAWQHRQRAQRRQALHYRVAAGVAVAAALFVTVFPARDNTPGPQTLPVAVIAPQSPTLKTPTVKTPTVKRLDAETLAVPTLPVTPVAPTRFAAADRGPQTRVDADLAAAQRFERTAETAQRLVYAFGPVGDSVSDVMRRVMDAVPGAGSLTL